MGRYHRRFRTLAWVIVLGAAGLAMSACGGVSNSNPSAGTYTFTVTGQDSANSNLTATTTFTFTIQ
jgi:hypothetical protein